MRRLDTDQINSGRAYFFGIIAFICILIQRSLLGVQILTETNVPNALYIIIHLLFIVVTVLAIYCAIQSLKEPTTKKKIIGLLFTALAVIQLSFDIIGLF